MAVTDPSSPASGSTAGPAAAQAPLLLHIGYHKTATTWMQRHLFHPRNGFRQLAGHAEVFAHIVRPHGLWFTPEPMQALIAARRADLAPGEVPVISSEILSGHPFLGGRESDVFADRLAEIAPGARILISIRSQLSILPSVYSQYLLRGGTMPYDRFFHPKEVPGYFGFAPEHFEYDRLLARYQERFGRDRVYVFPQEALRRDAQAAARALAAFAGVSDFSGLADHDLRASGVSYPEYAAPFLRRANHLQASTLNPTPVLRLGETPKGLYKLIGGLARRPILARRFGARKPVTAYVKRHFSGHYAASNARLAARVAHPLDLTGYEIAEDRPDPGG